ncbi:MAG: hypothetical protein GY852_06735 [bacterium]|nr:hypothetical protein [bacterium]
MGSALKGKKTYSESDVASLVNKIAPTMGDSAQRKNLENLIGKYKDKYRKNWNVKFTGDPKLFRELQRALEDQILEGRKNVVACVIYNKDENRGTLYVGKKAESMKAVTSKSLFKSGKGDEAPPSTARSQKKKVAPKEEKSWAQKRKAKVEELNRTARYLRDNAVKASDAIKQLKSTTLSEDMRTGYEKTLKTYLVKWEKYGELKNTLGGLEAKTAKGILREALDRDNLVVTALAVNARKYFEKAGKPAAPVAKKEKKEPVAALAPVAKKAPVVPPVEETIPLVPTVESDTPALDAQQMDMRFLRNLLTAPRPANEKERKARLGMLIQFYENPEIRTQFYDDYARANVLRTSLKKGEFSAEDAAEAREELRTIEKTVLPYYSKFIASLTAYAVTAAEKKEVAKIRKNYWKFGHKKLLKYDSSVDKVVDRLEKLRIKEAELGKVEDYLYNSADPRFERQGYTLYAGRGSNGKKRADAMFRTLVKSGLIEKGEARVSYGYENGKRSWRVELGTEYACAYTRATRNNLAGIKPYVPLSDVRDFQDNLDELFAHEVGDSAATGLGIYSETYLQINNIGADKKQYRVDFSSRSAAEKFYNLIANYGPMYGISINPLKGKDLLKRRTGWSVVVSSPKIEGVEAATIADDPLFELVMAPQPEELLAADPEVISQEGSDQKLSIAAKAWLKKNYKVDFAILSDRYDKDKKKYDAISPRTYKDWEEVAKLCEVISSGGAATAEAMRKAENKFQKNPELANEYAAFKAQLAIISDNQQLWASRLEHANQMAVELKSAKPADFTQIPRAVNEKFSHLNYGQRHVAINRYKEGKGWKHKFDEPRHARRVGEWLIAHNFEGVKIRGSTLVIEANPKRAKKTEVTEETAKEKFEKASLGPQELSYDQQQLLEYIYEGWSGPNSWFLEAGNQIWDPRYSTTERGRLLEALVHTVPGKQMRNLLDYIETNAYALMKQEDVSRKPLKIFIPRDADAEIVIAGVSLLFMAKGLQPPQFRTAIRKDKDKLQIRTVGKPQLYVKPMPATFKLPEADSKGDVLIIHNGKSIYLTKAQKDKVETAIREGKAFEITVFKQGKFGKLVDINGAHRLMQYLRERGYSNVGTKPWKGGRANAAVYASATAAGYWERPVSMFAMEVKNIKEHPALLKQRTALRAAAEKDAMFVESGKYNLQFNDSGRKVKGEERYGAIIDSYPPYLKEKPVTEGLTKEEKRTRLAKQVIRKRLVERDFRNVQVKELRRTVNTPGYETWIGYHSSHVAHNAARWLQDKLMARGDPRTVTVHSRGFRGLPQFRLYYMIVSMPSSNQFANRGAESIAAPEHYRFTPEGATNAHSVNITKNTRERVILEALLNGRAGRSHTFYLDAMTANALQSYLQSIGVPMSGENSMVTTEFLTLSEVPKEERDPILGWQPGEKQAVALTLTVPPVEYKAPLESRERGLIYRDLETMVKSDIPESSRNPRLKRISDRLLRFAHNEKLPKQDEFLVFDEKIGGEAMAKKFFGILSEYPELLDVHIEGNTLLVRKGVVSGRAEAEMEMRGAIRPGARWEYLEAQRPAVETAVQEIAVPYYKKKILEKEEYKGKEVTIEMIPLSAPGAVKQAFHESDPMKYGQDSVSFNNFNTAGQFNFQGAFRETRFDLLDRVANEEFAELPKGQKNFPRSAAVRVMKDLHLFHAGPGHNPAKSPDRIYGHEYAGVMYDVMTSVFPTNDGFYGALNDAAVAAGLMTGVEHYTKQIVSRNVNYGSMTTEQKRAHYEAVRRMVLIGTVSQIAHECGFAPSHKLLTPAQYKDYAMSVLIPNLNSTAKESTFIIPVLDAKGKVKRDKDGREITQEYRVIDRRAVTSGTEGAEVLLTVPIEGDPDHVKVVGYRKDGKNFIEKDPKNWKRRRVRAFDSLGALGATPRYVTGGFTFRIRIEEIPDKIIDKPIEVKIYPRAYVGDGYRIEGYQVKWKEDQFMFGMRQKKAYLDTLKSEEEIDPRITTVTYRVMERKNERFALILPPRHHYDESGIEVKQTNTRLGYPNGPYASACADKRGNLYVFRYKDKKERKEHDSEEGYPLNARNLYYRDAEYLADKGIEKVRVGMFDWGSGNIIYPKGKERKYYDAYGKHMFGHIRLTPSRMVKMKPEEVEDFEATDFSITPDPNYNYFRIKGLDVGAARDVEADLKVGETRASLEMALVGTNVPPTVVKEKKKPKKKGGK